MPGSWGGMSDAGGGQLEGLGPPPKPSSDQAAPRPSRVLRVASAVGVVLLTIEWLLPLATGAALIALLLGLIVAKQAGGATLNDAHVVPTAVASIAFACFVGAAVLLARFLNAASPRKAGRRSGLVWGMLAWLFAGPGELLVCAALAGGEGAELAVVFWTAAFVALVALWVAHRIARALWRLGGRSTPGAVAISLAAIVLVLIPDAVLDLAPAVLQEMQRERASLASGDTQVTYSAPGRRLGGATTASFGSQSAPLAIGGSDDDGDDEFHACYDELTGDACSGVWDRTRRYLGEEADTEDALNSALLYVCGTRKIRAPSSCGLFFQKARWLYINGWRYTHRFRDTPAPDLLACPLPTADDEAMSQEELDLLENARSSLSDRSRNILDLAYRDELTDRQIGARLGLAAVTVRVLRREAEKELAEKLKDCR